MREDDNDEPNALSQLELDLMAKQRESWARNKAVGCSSASDEAAQKPKTSQQPLSRCEQEILAKQGAAPHSVRGPSCEGPPSQLSRQEQAITAKQEQSMGMAASASASQNVPQLSRIEQDVLAKASIMAAVWKPTAEEPQTDSQLSRLEHDVLAKHEKGSLASFQHDLLAKQTTLSQVTMEQRRTRPTVRDEFELLDLATVDSLEDANDLEAGREEEGTDTNKPPRTEDDSQDYLIAAQQQVFHHEGHASGVLEAELVAPIPPVFEAKEIIQEKQRPQNSKMAFLILATVVLLTVTIVLAIVFTRRDGSRDSMASAPTSAVPGPLSSDTPRWTQRDKLYGQAPDESFGSGVAISHDGTVLAVSAAFAHGGINGTVLFAGHVRVYKYLNETWTQQGPTIEGSFERNTLGSYRSLALSGDGSTLVVGSQPGKDIDFVSVFRYDAEDNMWIQRGQDVVAVPGQVFGTSIQVSFDGDTFASVFFSTDLGQPKGVAVYGWMGDEDGYLPIGQPFQGKDPIFPTSSFTGLSSDGDRVVIGDHFIGPGEVRVYTKDEEKWILTGDPIVGLREGEQFGHSLACSMSCDTIIVSSWLGDARVFDLENGTWKPKGDSLPTPGKSSYSLAMSADGNRVSIAWDNEMRHGFGYVAVYDWSPKDSAWILTGAVEGRESDPSFPWEMELSGDGSTVVVSDRDGKLDNGIEAGWVEIYVEL